MIQRFLLWRICVIMWNKCSKITYPLAVKFGLSLKNYTKQNTEKQPTLVTKKYEVTKVGSDVKGYKILFCTWMIMIKETYFGVRKYICISM